MLPKASKSLVVEEGMEVPDISHGLQSVVLPYPVQVSVVIWHSSNSKSCTCCSSKLAAKCTECTDVTKLQPDWNATE